MPCTRRDRVRGCLHDPERGMMKANVTITTSDLISDVAQELMRSRSDWKNTAVIFPGKRPAYFLYKHLAASLGSSFIPPQVFSVDGWIDHLYRTMETSDPSRLPEIEAVAMLHDLFLSSNLALGKGDHSSLDNFLPLGFKLFGEFEEMNMNMVTPRALHQALSDIAMPELQAFDSLYDNFYSSIEASHSCTRAMRYNYVAGNISKLDWKQYHRIMLAGFFALTGSEQNIFQSLTMQEHAHFFFQEGPGLQAHLQKIGISHASHRTQAPKVKVFFYSAPDLHGQIFSLNRVLENRLLAGARVDETSVVILPSQEALSPIIEQTLPLLSDAQVNISLGYPLNKTPLYSFLSLLFDLLRSGKNGKLYIPAYLAFVLHPYTKNIRFRDRSDITRMMFHALENDFLRVKTAMNLSLEEIEHMVETSDACSAILREELQSADVDSLTSHLRNMHDRLIRVFDSTRDVRHFAEKIVGTLSFIAEESIADSHPFFDALLTTLLRNLDALIESKLGDRSFPSKESYLNFFKQYLATIYVPFPGTPVEGLQILGTLETRNISFDVVYFVQMNEDVYPGGAEIDLLLFHRVRELLGLPTRSAREDVLRYHFDVLMQHAKEAHLFFATGDGKEPSRFVEHLIWEHERRTGNVRDDSLVTTVQYNVDLANAKPQPIPKSEQVFEALRSFRFSATALDRYLHCPLQFYYTHILRLAERESLSDTIEAKEIGTFIHHVLHEFYRPCIGKRLTTEDVNVDRLHTVLDRCFVQSFGEDRTGSTFLIRQQIRSHLTEYIQHNQIPYVQSNEIVLLDLEKKIESTIEARSFKGFIDRIERRGRSVAIMDYKTGSDSSLKKINFKKLDVRDRAMWDAAIDSLQLPFYILLYAHATGVEVGDILPEYVWLGKHTVDEYLNVGIFDEAYPLTEYYPQVERIIFSLIEEIHDADRPFLPPSDPKKTCPRCSFRTICGMEWLAAK